MIAIWGSEENGGELKDEGNKRGNENSNEARKEEVGEEKEEIEGEVNIEELTDGWSESDVEEGEDKKTWEWKPLRGWQWIIYSTAALGQI